MTTHDTERTPLLAKTKANKDGSLECHEISCTTRYAILAALWAGTFLCVSRSLIRVCLVVDRCSESELYVVSHEALVVIIDRDHFKPFPVTMVATRRIFDTARHCSSLTCTTHSVALDHVRIQGIQPSQLDRYFVRSTLRPCSPTHTLVSYLLSTCTFTPLYGRLCTILGRRAACQTALLATALGTLLCGISGGMVELTVARFVRTLLFSSDTDAAVRVSDV
jgi:hypothetical protein